MTDRSVVARLRAEASQFLATMARSAKATEQVGTSAEKASKQATSAFDRLAKSVRANDQHINRLGNTALVAGGAITAGLGLGIKAFADFDEAMSSVNAALPEASAQMDKLRQLAIDLGKDSKFSSTEAAQGITELGKAGVDANAILGGGLKGSLDLAAAGQLDVARAAEVAATALKQFNLEGSDLPHVADLYAAAAGKAQGSVEDIAQAMKFAGVTSNGLGVSLEETVGTLGLFAEQGIIGEQAGTSLRSVLLSLTSPSQIAKQQMDALGISMYDAAGKFIGIGGAAAELQAKLGPLDDATRNAALGQIFGNESINAARKLYEGGATAVAKWTGQVNDAGFAAQQAAALTDNLKGDVERLGGALDAVFVQNGEGANGVLRDLVQSTEGAVEAFGALPQPVQQGAFALAGLTGATLLVGGALAKAVTTGADLVESMEALRVKAPRAAKGLDLTTKAARGAAIGFTALAAASILLGDDSKIPFSETTKAMLGSADAAKVFNDAIKELDLGDTTGDLQGVLDTALDPSKFEQAQSSVNGFFKAVSGGIIDLGNPLDLANEQLESLDQILAGLVSSGNAAEADRILKSIAASRPGTAIEDLTDKLPGYTESIAGADVQQTLAGKSAEKMADNVSAIDQAAQDAQETVSELAEEIRDFGKAGIDADKAESDFQEALAAVTDRLKERKDIQKQLREEQAKSGKDRDPEKIAELKDQLKDYAAGIDLTTEAGRANRDMLIAIAEAAQETSAQTLEVTGSEDKARESMTASRKEFIDSAHALGIKGKAAEDLADKYGLIPEDVKTVVEQSGAETARVAVQNLIDTIKRLNSKSVTVGIRYTTSGRLPNGGRNLGGGSTADADGAMHVQTGHGLVKAYADGGTLGAAQPQIARAGGAGILWAEEGAGPWEAFISGHPAKRVRSRSIAADTVERLGGRVEWRRFADGGIFGGGPTAHSVTHDSSLNAQNVTIVTEDARSFQRGRWRTVAYEAKARPGR